MQTFAAIKPEHRKDCPAVQWADLVLLTPSEKIIELTLSFPWLLGSAWFYSRAQWIPGAFCSFYFFLTGLRQSHGAQHYSLGISRVGHDLFLFLLSVLMFGSMHAVQTSHLNHHRHCLEDEDTEGKVAQKKWWLAVLFGPLFLARLHSSAWQLGNSRQRCWILAELIAIALMITVVAWFGLGSAWHWHATAMITGECFTAFFAVWIVHHDSPNRFGRTQRGPWITRLTYNMFFHLEHHLYPAVPTPHLHLLAARLDHVQAPDPKMVVQWPRSRKRIRSEISFFDKQIAAKIQG